MVPCLLAATTPLSPSGAMYAHPCNDPTTRLVTYCEFGKISVLAAATLREMGFTSAVALDGGFRDWVEAGAPVEVCPAHSNRSKENHS